MTPVLARRLNSDRAFERLYRKHAGDVYRYALVVMRNESDAEDVTQTTFMNAYRAMERGERPRQPQNWLITIAHNVCRQRFRQSQRRPSEVAYEEELAEATVDEDAISAEDIRRALGHLAFNQRSALVMRELEDRSYQEIAEIMGISVSAVETLIFRARRALREQLDEGITCREAELAISKQLDRRLSRQDKGALRAHLRECDDCAGFARSQRAQRGALKALGAIPLPQSLVGLFGGGGAAVGSGVAVKVAAVTAGAALATGVSYEGVKHGIVRSGGSTAAPAVVKKQPTRSATGSGSTRAAVATVLPRRHEAAIDQKPFRKAAVKARATGKGRGKPASGKPFVTKPVKNVSSPSNGNGAAHKVTKPAHPTHPVTPSAGRSHGQNAGGNGKAKTNGAGKKKQTQPPAKAKGKGGGGGGGNGAADTGDGTAGHGKSGR
jgi:RNA polymerase sigma-70 factor, ECF subfamily